MADKTKKNIANCVPVALVDHEISEEGVIKLLVPRFRSRWMQWMQKRLKKPHVKVVLDEVGTAAWKLIDSKRTIHDIGNSLESEFGEKIQPVNQRLGLFFSVMRKHKLITWDEDHAVPVEQQADEKPVEPQ